MKFPTVIALWLLAAALGITAYFVKFHGNDAALARTKIAPGERLFANLPIREIYHVTLIQGDNATHLVRDENNGWGIKERGNYTINYELLRDLLGSLNSLEITQGYPTEQEYFGRFGLADEISESDEKRGYEGAIKVTMSDKDGDPLAEVSLGKFSGSVRVGGRFVRITGDDSGVYAVAQTFPGITANPKDWLAKGFLKVDLIQSIAVAAPQDPTFSNWELNRANPQGQFSLANMKANELMQLTSTNTLRNLFNYSAFRDVLTKEQAEQLSEPDEKLQRRATITTFDGLTYQLTFWPHKALPKDPDADSRLPAPAISYNLTVSVSANIPAERPQTTAEKPEDAATLDQQFMAAQKAAQEKLASAKAFEGRIFQISGSIIAPLQKLRSDFVKPAAVPNNTPSALPSQ